MGWGLSVERLAELHKRAAEMRRNPTEPEKRLWRCLSSAQLAGHKFRRQSVIGWFIADFLCPQKALIVEVDGDTHDEGKDRLRDDVLGKQGFRVLRVTNLDVMSNIEGVLEAIRIALAGTPDRWASVSPSPSRQEAAMGSVHQNPADRNTDSPHPNPFPKGEGLEAVEARKSAGIGFEGRVE